MMMSMIAIVFAIAFFWIQHGYCFRSAKPIITRKGITPAALSPAHSKERPSLTSNRTGSELSIGIACAKWNSDIVECLYEGVMKSLASHDVSCIQRIWVPGSFELPFAAKFLADKGCFDAIICLGCLVKGETMHFEYIAQAASQGIMHVQLEHRVPCLFGVLTVMNKQQAIERSSGKVNEGLSWGCSAVEMGLLRKMTAVTQK